MEIIVNVVVVILYLSPYVRSAVIVRRISYNNKVL